MEAVVGIFVMIAAFLVLTTLFHSGLRYVHRIEARNLAVMLAERKMEELRLHAQTLQGGRYGYFDFSPVTGASADPEYPDFVVDAQEADQPLFSPSSTDEVPLAGQERLLASSAKLVRVTVRWDQGASRISLYSFIGEPAATAFPGRRFRNSNPIVVTPTNPPIPAVLGRDQPVSFTATGYDQNDQAIADLFFDWYIEPGLFNATVSQSRDGRTGTLTNVITIPGQLPAYSGGQVVVVARAVYRGQEAFGYSAPVTLQP
ncbi:MAG: hypothetical protein AB1758_21040 [Candidatus Eremiobacterota bacterium]